MQEALASTLRVAAIEGSGSDRRFSVGSGVAVAPNIVLTNLHVVALARGNRDALIYVWDNSAGFPRPASTIIETDARLDLAILFVRGIESSPTTFAIANPPQLEQVTALGFPAASDMIFGRLRESASATTGQVTAVDDGPLGEIGTAELLLHTATVNPGNSGGPLFNRCGELVGINTLRANPEDVSNAFIASSVGEIHAFLASFGIDPSVAKHVCATQEGQPSANCQYDRAELDRALEERSLIVITKQLRAIPGECTALREEAANARQMIASQAIQHFLHLSGTWRLPEQECDDRTWLSLSGLSVWGLAGDHLEIEQITGVVEGAVTTQTIEPPMPSPTNFRYSLAAERLRIENLSSNSSWELIRCTG
jgi:hypothetical protein